jgi:hypothetical protein
MDIADQNCTATHNYATTPKGKETNNGKNQIFSIPKLGHRKFVV